MTRERRQPRKLGRYIPKNKASASASDAEIIFGIHAVTEALEAGKDIDKLYIKRGLQSPALKKIEEAASAYGIPVLRVPEEKLNRTTPKNHQGIVALASPVSFVPLDRVVREAYEAGKTPLLVILDRVTDVRNFGAVARTAECAGADGIVFPSRGTARIGGDALKTSSGALNFIPLIREDNLKHSLRYLKDSGIKIVACTEKAEKLIYEIDLSGPVALLLGSEEDGVSPEYLRLADESVKFPVYGHIASLNVSVAAGLAIYETIRQRIK